MNHPGVEQAERATRILIISDRFPPYDRGGAERIAFYDAEALSELGYEVAVVSAAPPVDELPASSLGEFNPKVYRDIPLYPLARQGEPGVIDKVLLMGLEYWNPLLSASLELAVQDFKPDLIHGHHISRFSYGAFARLAPEVPRVLTFHDYHFECPKGGLYRKRRQSICMDKPLPCRIYRNGMSSQLASVDRIIAISSFIRQRLLDSGYPEERILYLPNGVPGLDDRAATPPSGSKEILYVGRVVHNKGLSSLLQAFGQIKDPEARLIVVGDGEQLPSLKQQYRGEARVEWLGWLDPDQVAERYRRCRMLACPSLWHEVMSTVICEAAAWSRPVVATRVGGNEDLLVDGESGYLCSTGDVQALSDRMAKLLQDDPLAADMGSKAFAHVKRFGMARHKRDLSDLYEEMELGPLTRSNLGVVKPVAFTQLRESQ